MTASGQNEHQPRAIHGFLPSTHARFPDGEHLADELDGPGEGDRRGERIDPVLVGKRDATNRGGIEMSNDKQRRTSGSMSYKGLGMTLGLVLGGLLGWLSGNIAISAGGGMVLGLAVGTALDRRGDRSN